nr:hypothetical protein [Candidatus Njordarchaeum guaymaensis]
MSHTIRIMCGRLDNGRTSERFVVLGPSFTDRRLMVTPRLWVAGDFILLTIAER